MPRPRLPGGVNRTAIVRGALLALGPDEWLQLGRLAASMGVDSQIVTEILCRLRAGPPGVLESRASSDRGRTGKRFYEWRIAAGMRDVLEAGGAVHQPKEGRPRGMHASPAPDFVASAALCAAVAAMTATPGVVNTR